MLQVKRKLKKKIEKIKLILLDVDGVLTDGGIYYDNNGDEIKKFNVKDGSGIKMAIKAGINVAIVTGRVSNIVIKRAEELDIKILFQGVKQKHKLLKEISEKYNFKREEIAFIADDVIDLELFKLVGLKVAVQDAHYMIKREADLITKLKGGAGAVREFIDIVLEVQNLWSKALSRYC